jgi:hypothetical protein
MVCKGRAEDFESHKPVERHLVSQVDNPHPASTQAFHDSEVANLDVGFKHFHGPLHVGKEGVLCPTYETAISRF